MPGSKSITRTEVSWSNNVIAEWILASPPSRPLVHGVGLD